MNFHPRKQSTLPRKKKLAKTSKTGLKLDQKLLLIPSPERTGYRKSYLARRLTAGSLDELDMGSARRGRPLQGPGDG